MNTCGCLWLLSVFLMNTIKYLCINTERKTRLTPTIFHQKKSISTIHFTTNKIVCMKNNKRRYICISFTTSFAGPVKTKSIAMTILQLARCPLIIAKMFYSSFLEWFFLRFHRIFFFQLHVCLIQLLYIQ